VIAALQALGGTPTVTLKTTHKYFDGKAAPAAPAVTPAPAAQPTEAPKTGAQSRPAILPLLAAHRTAARFDGGAAR
jgi:hypothetical protein